MHVPIIKKKLGRNSCRTIHESNDVKMMDSAVLKHLRRMVKHFRSDLRSKSGDAGPLLAIPFWKPPTRNWGEGGDQGTGQDVVKNDAVLSKSRGVVHTRTVVLNLSEVLREVFRGLESMFVFGSVQVHHGIATAIASDFLNRRRNRKEFPQ